VKYYIKHLSKILCGLLLCNAIASHATIPNSITGLYNVFGSDNCPTTCTVQNGGTLTISGAGITATFSGSITVMPGGKLYIQNGATVKMAANTKIAVKGGSAAVNAGGALYVHNGHITSTAPNVFWSGIETSTSGYPGTAYVQIGDPTLLSNQDNLVENAIVGLRNYDSGNPNINATSGGALDVRYSTMRNNIRHLALYNSQSFATPDNIVNAGSTISMLKLFQYVTFINTATFNPPVAPVDMVYLNNCTNIPLWSCQFHNYNTPAYNTTLKGINAVNASFFLQSYPYSSNPQTTYRCAMTGFGTAVAATNALQTNRVCIVANTDFDSCTYTVNFSGCFKPLIVNTTIHMLQNSGVTQGGIYMDNCTGYTVEANNISAVGIKNIFGILPRNSGTAANQVYRNAVVNCETGVEAMGINRSADGFNGLQILCNNLSSVYKSGIYVVPTSPTIPPPSFGIAIQQMNVVTLSNPATNVFASAANTFSNGSPLTSDFKVYPTSYVITPYSGIFYRYSPAVAGQKPVNTNLATANIIATTYNSTCPAQTPGSKPTPYPFSMFVQNNAAIEKQIRDVKTDDIASTDPTEILAYLHTQQAKLINGIIDYYQYMDYTDTTGKGDYTDSIARVYQQVTIGYEYQIYLASAFADKGRYDDAISTLNAIPGQYILNDEETTYINNLNDLFTVRQWLYQNDNSWDRIPGNLKDRVYQHEQDDAMFAGAMARSLLAQYEARNYDPIYIAPEDTDAPMGSKVKPGSANNIYPNPATDHLLVSHTGDNAVLVLTDMTGREALRQPLNSNQTIINIKNLPSGMYYAVIWSGVAIQYQQKVVKQ